MENKACSNSNDKQFFNKLCSNIPTNKFALNKINNRSSTNSQASKFSSYVDRHKYTSIFEGKVKDLTMTFATPTSATIIFFPVGYPKTVTLSIQNQNQNEQFDTQSISILTSPYTFNNLKPNTNYDIIAMAKYSSGSVYTENFKNAVETLNEGPPTNVGISNITNKTALISYTYPIGVVDTLEIIITNVNDPSDKQTIENNLTDTYNITELRINSTYRVVITSAYIITKNKYTVTFPFTTLFEDFPTNILFTNITNENATVSYIPIGYPLYNNIIVVNNENAVESYSLNTLETSTTWDLNSNTTYNVKITSVYAGGNKYPVSILNAFYILNEGLPQNIQFINIKGTSLLFSFVNSIGNPSYYQLNLQNTTTETDKQQIYIDVNKIENILIGGSISQELVSNSTYSFQLQSVYLSTGNKYTYTTQFQTLNEGPISNFNIIHVGNNYISFSFNYPPGESYILNLIANNSVDYKSLNITANNYTLQKLLINADYKIIINTIYTLSNATYTYTYPYTLTTLNEGPSIINNIEYITNTYAYINFYNPYAIADQYIFNSVPTTPELVVKTVITGMIGGNIFINGLSPNTSYITTLQSIYHTNTSEETVYTTVPSIKINTKDWPRNIQVDVIITDTSASITFVAPNIEPNKYSIFTNNNQLLFDYSLNEIQVLNRLSHITINSLVPNTTYILSLASYYEDTQSYYTNPITFSITTKGPARNVNISSTTTSANITFNTPLLSYNWNYNILLYKNTDMVSSYLRGIDTNYIFNDIIPNTTYNIKIDAIYNNSIYNDNQIFTSIFYYFNTRGFPDNIKIIDVTSNSFTITWNTLLYTAYNYTLMYTFNPTKTIDISNSDISVSTVSNTSSYIVNNLNPDISYSNITISSNYKDIQTSYTTSESPLNVATYTYPAFTVVSKTNTKITISFLTPFNTVPDRYIISVINTNTNVQTDISFSSITYNTQNTNYNYDIPNLSDNIKYQLFMSSYYNVNNFVVSSPRIYTDTKGTPVITSFTNIFDIYATINIQPLLISPPNNYTIYIFTAASSTSTSYSINFDSITNSYTTPSILPYFNANTTYRIQIESNYLNDEKYKSSIYTLNTRGSSEINSVITTDVSGIVYIEPSVSWDIYNVQVSYILQTQTQTQSNDNITVYSDQSKPYFYINNLSPNVNHTISIKITYLDTTASYQSLPYSFYTKGPPTNLTIDPTGVFNTYLTVNFTPPYNCSNYTLYAVPVPTNQNTTIISQPFSTLLSTYTSSSNFLSENTNYNIYVASNFANFNGNSNKVNITTYSTPIIVDFSNNITDVSAGVLFKKPLIIPDDIKYSYNNNAFTITTSTSITDDGAYIYFVITGLSPNTTYRNFKIQNIFKVNNATYTSVSNTFYTKGITNISTLTTNNSALISFPTPFVIPKVYYYNINNTTDISFSPVLNNNIQQYTISNLTENTNYNSLLIKTTYSNISGIYSSQNVSFVTKMIPKIIDTVITDTTLSVYFTKCIIDPSYSYIIDEYADAYPYKSVKFVTSGSPSTVTILNLTPNTFYNTFKIEAYYSDINQIYSSTNYSFNTMGNPTSVVLSTPPTNKNTTTLSFYPPLYDPSYYIIYDNKNQDKNVYISDLSYNNNNIYSYTLNNVSRDYINSPFDMSYIGISISSVYDVVTPKITLPVNTFQFMKNTETDIINSIATNNTGNYVTITTTTNKILYYNSSNIWNTYTSTNDDTFIKVVMDTTGIYQYVLSNKNIYVWSNTDNADNEWTTYQFNNGKDICTDSIGKNIFVVGSLSSLYSIDYGKNWNTLSSINATNCMMNNSYIYYTTQDGNINKLSKNFTTTSIVATVTTTTNNNFLLCTNDTNTNLVVGYSTGNNNTTLIRSVDGVNWNTISDSSLNWTSISSDASGTYLTATNMGIGTYVSENGGISWDILLPTFPNLKNTIISRNGMYMYAYDTNNIYSYKIPLEKAAVYNITATIIRYNTAFISFNPPSFIPDLSYTIIATNRMNALETRHIYYTAENSINIDNLSSNCYYDISVNANYSNKLQTFTSSLNQPFYTLSPPLDLSLYGNPNDISASIFFTKPFNTPSSYQVDVSRNGVIKTIDIELNDIQNNNQTGYYIITDISQNAWYSLILKSIYKTSLSASINFSSNSISFYTRGSPYDPIVNNTYDTSANISFTSPYNLDGFQTYRITCIPTTNPLLQISTTNSITNVNVELNDLSQNTIYDISLSTVYSNPDKIVSTNYSNVIYTKGGPSVSLYNLLITDISAIVEFVTPISIQNTPSLLDHYELYINNSLIKSFKNEIIYSTPDIPDISFILLSDLVPNTIYFNSIYIKTYYTDVSGVFNSNYLNITTEGYPQNIYSDYNFVQDISATIKFTPPYNPPSNYTIFLKNGSLLKYSLTTDISTNVLKNLSINTIYYVAVQSNYDNLTTISPDISFITAGKTIIQQITNITDTSANISFIPPLLIPSYYTILVYRQSDNINILQYDISNTKTAYTMTNLPQNNKLSVYIQTVYPNVRLTSDISSSFITYGPPNSIFFVANTITDTSAIVQFSQPLITSDISYNILLTNVGNNIKKNIQNVSSPVLLSDLSSNSTYEIVLQSYYNALGLYSNSNIIGLNTEGVVANIEYTEATDSSILLSFKNNASTPNSYNLRYFNPIVDKTIQNIVNPYTVFDLSSNTYYNSQIQAMYDTSWYFRPLE